MITGIVQFFYPDIKKEDVKKVTLLGLTFLFTIGAYWLLRLLKDVVLYKLAFPVSLGYTADEGRTWVPFVKGVSPWLVLAVVTIYTKLVDMFEKYKLFYIIVSFYTIVFGAIGTVLYLQATHGDAFVGATILKLTGVGGYLLTESFGSVVVALFWSFTISSTTSEQAKSSFPFIVALGQIGSIGGSSLVLIKNLPTWPLYFIAVTFLAGIILTVKYLMSSVPASQMKSDKEEKKKAPDFFGGLRLLLTKPYLMGVLVVSTFYEIAGTIVDYQMKSQASIIEGIDFKWFMGVFGVSVNALAFVMALLGTSKLMKRYGIRVCILIYPLSFAAALVALYGYYMHTPTPMHLLWATFGVMLIVKAASYAVNNPVKEMMYIPTSKDAKFKAKGIVDMLGNRSAKMSGAQIGGVLNVKGNPLASVHNLMLYGSLISLGIIGAWFMAALYVGNKNKQLVDSGEIVE